MIPARWKDMLRGYVEGGVSLEKLLGARARLDIPEAAALEIDSTVRLVGAIRGALRSLPSCGRGLRRAMAALRASGAGPGALERKVRESLRSIPVPAGAVSRLLARLRSTGSAPRGLRLRPSAGLPDVLAAGKDIELRASGRARPRRKSKRPSRD